MVTTRCPVNNYVTEECLNSSIKYCNFGP